MWLVFFLSEKKEIGTFRNGELDDVRCLPGDVEDVDARTRSIDRFSKTVLSSFSLAMDCKPDPQKIWNVLIPLY